MAFNASAELAAIGTDRYSRIRVFTVGQDTSSDTPLQQLGTIVQPWAAATSAVIGLGNWSSYSAVCWFTLRNLYDAMNGTVPMGGISNNWGGTPIEVSEVEWSD